MSYFPYLSTHFVCVSPYLDVAMDAVFQSPGSAMESLIVRIRRMKERRAMAPTHVMNRSSSVETTSGSFL